MSAPIWFDSTETGAPVLNNAAGSLIALLRAVLVNGFNVRAITSIAVASGVATVTCQSHGFRGTYGKWLQINGSPVAALNGVKQQTIVDANTFTYPAPGVADGTYTATDARRAPLGWTESFTNGAGTISVFSRTVPEALAQQLRVNDSGAAPATASSARLLMVRGATSVDAWDAQAPLESQLSGGIHCNKGTNNATAKQWVAVGDERNLWLFVGDSGATNLVPSIVFADITAYRPGDLRATVISGTGTVASTSDGSSGMLSNTLLGSSPTSFGSVVMQSRSGLGDPIQIGSCGYGTGNINVFGAGGSQMATDAEDYQIVRPVLARDTDLGVRGESPGLGQLLAIHTVFSGPFAVITPESGVPWLAVRTRNFANTGAACFSLADDWY